jgi:nucleoside-diphosphate-sugar epimerase
MSGLVLVTGASGFLGAKLCAALVARGRRVRALYRRPAPPPELAALEAGGVELLRGDLACPETATLAVSGAQAVIHAAALASDWGHEALFWAANVDATRNLLGAAQKAGCSTFVYISSAVVHGFGPHVDTDEEGPYRPLHYPYQITKLEAERLVLARSCDDFRCLAIRPCNVYGPGDRTSTYAMFSAIMDGRFGYLGDGSAYTCPVYIDDLVEGVLRALDCLEAPGWPRCAGMPILLSDGEKVSWKRYVEIMYAAAGSRKRPLSLPVWLAKGAASGMSAAWRLLGAANPPPLTSYRVEQGSRHYHFSNHRARELLDFEPRIRVEEGLVRTAKAFLEERAVREAGQRSSARI